MEMWGRIKEMWRNDNGDVLEGHVGIMEMCRKDNGDV